MKKVSMATDIVMDDDGKFKVYIVGTSGGDEFSIEYDPSDKKSVMTASKQLQKYLCFEEEIAPEKKVVVSDSGARFSTYASWAERHLSNRDCVLFGYGMSKEIRNGMTGTVICIHEHSDNVPHKIAAVRMFEDSADECVMLIGVNGLKVKR